MFSPEKAALGELVASGYMACAYYDGDSRRLQRWQSYGWDLAAQNR